jgi:hypothetical protein
MALWNPPSEIAAKEHIGRRKFERHRLRGGQDQRPPFRTLELYHFQETRGAGEVSLDRLGKTGIEKAVKKYLNPRARADGTKFKPPRSFEGWFYVTAVELRQPVHGPPLALVYSPVGHIDGEELSGNQFHAHVERPSSFSDDYADDLMAMHLKTIFERDYRFEPAIPVDAPPSWLRQLIDKLCWWKGVHRQR